MNRPPRIVVATPLADGHDVAAAAITRIIRREQAEAVYLGFNRTAGEIVKASAEEDATGIAISTYNGGHLSFLREVIKEQNRYGIGSVPLFAGGGGTILERDVAPLIRMGVAKVYRPPLDLTEAVLDMIERSPAQNDGDYRGSNFSTRMAKRLTAAEWYGLAPDARPSTKRPFVWGIGGRGGAGKSTTIDELLARFLASNSGRIGVITADPTLGDRLRMIYCYDQRVYLRSVRVGPGDSTESKLGPILAAMREEPFELILVESVGLGQNDLGVAPLTDASIYCMTPEYGSDVQLEKEALLNQADIVVMNKGDFPESEARARRVKRFLNHAQEFVVTEAKRHADHGVNHLFDLVATRSGLPSEASGKSAGKPNQSHIPFNRRTYLGLIADAHADYYTEMDTVAEQSLTDPEVASKFRALFESIWQERGFTPGEEATTESEGLLYRSTGDGKPVPIARQTTTGLWMPVTALPPRDSEPKAIVRYLYKQGAPGQFPYTEGAYPYRRSDEDPIRMFAGLGTAETTNNRFHLLADGHGSPRLSTAFDSLTLYGLDSDAPGALAKVGEGGVAIDTIDDMERLYQGFDLSQTSVSMTINGPAATLFAMFIAAAKRRGFKAKDIKGTVQTDILKEVQAQNEALFPLEPSLRLIGDMADYTLENTPSWYPLSISGYHIGEAGANPIQELAFTLANAFTYIEIFRSRGTDLSKIAPRLSFFFTSGSEIEFNALGRVARRIWAVGLARAYKLDGNGRALKFHSQTSGRSLQDQNPLHNLTRVAIQAEHALHNNTNSLHTNSYKETYSTPEQDDVVLAMGSQQIPLVEGGDFRYTENLNQGAYGLSVLEDQVEQEVYRIFREIDQLGGVISAIENEYFRTSIQEEVQKEQIAARAGNRKVVGVNYLAPATGIQPRGKLVTIPTNEKRAQIARTREFKNLNEVAAASALARLQAVALSDGNVFEELLATVEVATVGQITEALQGSWGRFRPSM